MSLENGGHWPLFTKRIAGWIESPKSAGMRLKGGEEGGPFLLVEGEESSLRPDLAIRLQLLFDREDGRLADIRYQHFGPPELIAFAEKLAFWALRRSHVEIRDLSPERLLEEMELEKIPTAWNHSLSILFSALHQALIPCKGLPIPSGYTPLPDSPKGESIESLKEGEWQSFSQEMRLAFIEKVLDQEIRPYIAMDEGGIEVVDLKELAITVRYSGACTSCGSSIGATLSAIVEILREKVHPGIEVIPDMDHLQF